MAAVPHRASLFPVAKLRRRLESSKAAGPALKLPLVSKHSTLDRTAHCRNRISPDGCWTPATVIAQCNGSTPWAPDALEIP